MWRRSNARGASPIPLGNGVLTNGDGGNGM